MGKKEIAVNQQFYLFLSYASVVIWQNVLPFTTQSQVLTNSRMKRKNAVNPFPYKPWFLHVCSTSLLKTLWEKKKLLVTSNFSFSHRVFYLFGEFFAISIKFEIVVCKLSQFGRVQNLSFGKGLIRVFYYSNNVFYSTTGKLQPLLSANALN